MALIHAKFISIPVYIPTTSYREANFFANLVWHEGDNPEVTAYAFLAKHGRWDQKTKHIELLSNELIRLIESESFDVDEPFVESPRTITIGVELPSGHRSIMLAENESVYSSIKKFSSNIELSQSDFETLCDYGSMKLYGLFYTPTRAR